MDFFYRSLCHNCFAKYAIAFKMSNLYLFGIRAISQVLQLNFPLPVGDNLLFYGGSDGKDGGQQDQALRGSRRARRTSRRGCAAKSRAAASGEQSASRRLDGGRQRTVRVRQESPRSEPRD